MTNLTAYLDTAATLYPDKTAFTDGVNGLAFGELRGRALAVGAFLRTKGVRGPVAVLMERGADMVAAFFGVLYGGAFYVPLDLEMGAERIGLILENLNPSAVILSSGTFAAADFEITAPKYTYEEITKTPIDGVFGETVDTDAAYVVFTSGSTGVPKGVVASHGAVISYIEGLSAVLNVDEADKFGSQAPLYVDACLKEIMLTLKHGATTYFIPKSLFMFPIKLVEYLNKHEISAVCWVSSVLTICANMNVLEKFPPLTLKTIAFGSEVLPRSVLDRWRVVLPDARFINLYGPTEATGMSCWYEVGELPEGEPIPIGRPFPNTKVFLLDGEIVIGGGRLALGYYNDAEKTAAAFVQNPLNTSFRELIYRTGDLGRYNERGELVYLGRSDGQIKHLGHRIEIGEIEAAALKAAGVGMVLCMANGEAGGIALFFTGGALENDVLAHLRRVLPRWMVPTRIIKLDSFPYSNNMKIDRQELRRILNG